VIVSIRTIAGTSVPAAGLFLEMFRTGFEPGGFSIKKPPDFKTQQPLPFFSATRF
jgi:hypothetical protein